MIDIIEKQLAKYKADKEAAKQTTTLLEGAIQALEILLKELEQSNVKELK